MSLQSCQTAKPRKKPPGLPLPGFHALKSSEAVIGSPVSAPVGTDGARRCEEDFPTDSGQPPIWKSIGGFAESAGVLGPFSGARAVSPEFMRSWHQNHQCLTQVAKHAKGDENCAGRGEHDPKRQSTGAVQNVAAVPCANSKRFGPANHHCPLPTTLRM